MPFDIIEIVTVWDPVLALGSFLVAVLLSAMVCTRILRQVYIVYENACIAPAILLQSFHHGAFPFGILNSTWGDSQ